MKKSVRYALGGFAGVVTLGLVGSAAFIAWLTRDLPSYDALTNYEPPVTTRVYAGNGTLIGEYARERRLFVPIEAMPPQLKAAFLSAEDKNFYNHPGVDVSGIARAIVYNLQNSGRPQGASTITQQVARVFLLSSDVNYSRKVREAILAMRIDSAFTKDKILELYLNQIFLGDNSYGVTAAAVNYFSKPLNELTLGEIAYLAALPKGPANYHPIRRKAAAIVRRNWVIDQMHDNGYVTAEEAAKAKAEDLVTYQRPFGAVAQDVDYFVEEVRRVLYGKYGQEALYDGGLQVRTTLDTRLQNIAVRALRTGLTTYDRRHGWRGPVAKLDVKDEWQAKLKAVPNRSGVPTWRLAMVTSISAKQDVELSFEGGEKGLVPLAELAWARKKIRTYVGPEIKKATDVVSLGDVVYVEKLVGPGKASDNYGLRQIPEVNGAIVAIDPFTGDVLALSGGFSFASSEFDRAMQAQRQPGSTFKPFVYAAALDSGYTPISRVLDSPFAVPQGPGLPLWTPQNYEEGEFLGLTTLRKGLELSRNVMTARLAHEIGIEKIGETVERMGVYEKLPRLLSMSLGAGESTLLKVTTGYAQFVNGGRKLEPTLVSWVQDRTGKTVYRFDDRECPDCNHAEWMSQEEPLLPENRPQVLDPRTAYQVVSMMEGVVQRGTGTVVKEVGKPLAGKTGTSSENRDVWFVGFSPDLAVGVYLGFDNPQSLGATETGGRNAAPIFRDFMAEALADQEPTPFRIPAGVVLVEVNGILEAFKPGTEPGQGYSQDDHDRGIRDDGFETARAASANTPPPSDTVDTDIGEGTGGLY